MMPSIGLSFVDPDDGVSFVFGGRKVLQLNIHETLINSAVYNAHAHHLMKKVLTS